MPTLPYKIPTCIKHMHTCPNKCPHKCTKGWKCLQEAIAIDEVKCRNKLAKIWLQKSTFVSDWYYFSWIVKIYVRQIKYLEMNIPTRFQGGQLVYILIGGEIWLDKEKQIKWSSIVMLSLMHAYLLWIYYIIVDTFIMWACPYMSQEFQW